MSAAAPGYSSGQAREALEDVFAQTMPREMGFDYSGMSYQEQKAAEGVPRSSDFWTFTAVCIPDSRGPIRKLVAPLERFAWERPSPFSAPSHPLAASLRK